MKKNNFSIIILNHNNKYIEDCIASVIKNKDIDDEIIIVDDNSTKANFNKLVKRFDKECVIIQNTIHPKSLSVNRNLGAKISQKNYLLFLDGDAFFYNDTIEQLRNSLDKDSNIVCSTPFADGMSIAPMQLKHIYNVDIMDFIKEIRIEEIILKYYIKDFRRNVTPSQLEGRNNWYYFYGVCLAVKKEAYFKCGCFDETLDKWGIEDIDFTYRLNKIGKLDFVSTAAILHIPHERDRYLNFANNAYSNMKCVKKYEGELDWELHYKFSDLYSVKQIIRKILYFHKDLKYEMVQKEKVNSVYIDAITKTYPNGRIIFYDSLGECFEHHHFGVCLPFKNKQFNTCYFSYFIFNYPSNVISILLQELCRISRVVKCKIEFKNNLLKWSNDEEKLCRHHTPRFEVFPVKLSDFIFTEKDGYIEITTSLPDSPYENMEGVYYNVI